jgi:FSR family fosmidomycin resistance protein-like MFS transporter
MIDEPFQRRTVGVLAVGHAINDAYTGFLPPLLPLLIARFDLSLTLAGALVTLRMMSGQMAQPIYGYLADRLSSRAFIVLGPLITAVFISLIGVAPNYASVVALVLLSGIGTAAFHPQSAALVARASGRHHSRGMGLFLGAGWVGFSIGPLFGLLLVSTFGLWATVLMVWPGLLITLMLYHLAPMSPRHDATDTAPSLRASLSSQGHSLFLLLAIATLRTMVINGFIGFLPVLLKVRGFSLLSGGGALAVFLFSGGVVGVPAGGYLAERVSMRLVVGSSLMMSIPLLVLMVHSEGFLLAACLVSAGMILCLSESVLTSWAQRLLPGNMSTASSVTMGLAFGLGSVAATLVGAIADRIGVEGTLTLLSWLPLLPAFLTLVLPRDIAVTHSSSSSLCDK